jgi:UDP-N-acetyl-D-glucosamine dehydrogenase
MPNAEGHLEGLRAKLSSFAARIGVIGLGYVGLPLAMSLSEKFTVVGYDSDANKVELIARGRSPVDDVSDETIRLSLDRSFVATSSEDTLRGCDVLIICVPTPLDARGDPDLSYVQSASEVASRAVKKGMMLILESTSYPGTTEEYLGRAIERAGLVPGDDVALAFSPERVDPGNRRYDITNTPKVVGGVDDVSTSLANMLYSSIVTAGVVQVSSCAAAEATKIVENIFRGVNIALINELSLVFERMGINTWEVVDAAATKPFGFMPHYPGPGVGGHCIPLDPIYLSYKAKQLGYAPRFIELSREVNEFMKHHTANLVIEAVRRAEIPSEKAVVGVLGLAYKKGISDTRESPSIGIVEEISKRVGRVVAHDPKATHIDTRRGRYESSSLDSVLEESDCIVFVTDHDEYRSLSLSDIARRGVKAVVDTRNLFEATKAEEAGLVYMALGK